jgi:hypothetical protein
MTMSQRSDFRSDHRASSHLQSVAPDNEDLFELYARASRRLCRTAPTTADGVLALLDYVISKRYDETYCSQVGVTFYHPLLNSIREGLRATAEHDVTA